MKLSYELELKAEAIRQRKPIEKLASEMQVHPTYLSKTFSGERSLKTTEFARAAKALHISASELVRRAEEAEERKAGK